MQFKDGTSVYTSDGERVGSIERVVIEPRSKEVTHLIVEKGFLFKEDKVVPMSLVGPATEDRVTLRKGAGDLEKLPDFEESYFISTEVEAAARPPKQMMPGIGSIYWYPPVGSKRNSGIFGSGTAAPYIEETIQNIPQNTVALKEGARVITLDKKHVGDIEEIFTDVAEDKVTHILISQGVFLKEKKLIPITWISNIKEGEVSLLISSQLVENLPEYRVEA
ncbi:MAG: PRC-barrel domain-containing protein [Candidatus Promineifilaceae bacterium]|jgi:uncharacterized protein YrrD